MPGWGGDRRGGGREAGLGGGKRHEKTNDEALGPGAPLLEQWQEAGLGVGEREPTASPGARAGSTLLHRGAHGAQLCLLQLKYMCPSPPPVSRQPP